MSKTRKLWLGGTVLAAVAALAFTAGRAVGASQVNMPNSVIHHVALKWKAGVTDAQKQEVLDGLKEIVSEVPGAKNMWMKTVKVQPQGYSQTFVIEFENEAALKAYAENPKKKAWNDKYYAIREESRNCVTTN